MGDVVPRKVVVLQERVRAPSPLLFIKLTGLVTPPRLVSTVTFNVAGWLLNMPLQNSLYVID